VITTVVKWAIENYGIVTAAGTAVLTFFIFLKKWTKNAIRSFTLSDKFHDLYGDDPAEKIKDTQELHRYAKDLLSVRVSISEQWLKIGMYICNKEGECTWTNECINNIFGLDSQEMLGFGWLSAIGNSDRKRIKEEWLYAVNNNIPYDAEYRVENNRDSILTIVRTKALAVVDQDNNVKCYIGYLKENYSFPFPSCKTKNETEKAEEGT
jgi:PAS domain-containing protein